VCPRAAPAALAAAILEVEVEGDEFDRAALLSLGLLITALPRRKAEPPR
jgi:hypothetical protein